MTVDGIRLDGTTDNTSQYNQQRNTNTQRKNR